MGAYVINKQAGSNEPHRSELYCYEVLFFFNKMKILFASEI